MLSICDNEKTAKRGMKMMVILQKTLESQNTFSLIRLRSGSTISIRNLNTVTWLECETVMVSGKKMVRLLKCSICSKYTIRVDNSRNFRIDGLSVPDCFAQAMFETMEKNNQHTQTMSLLIKERATCCGQGPYNTAQ